MKKLISNAFEKTVENTKKSSWYVDSIFVITIMITLGAFAIDDYLYNNLAKVSEKYAFVPFAGLAILSLVTIAVITFYNGVIKRHGYIIATLGVLISVKLILEYGTKLVLSNTGSVVYFFCNWIMNLSILAFEKYLFLDKFLSTMEISLLFLSFLGIIYTIGYFYSVLKGNQK